VPSLALEALRLAQGADSIAVKSSGASRIVSFGEHTGISQIRVGSRTVPTDAEGRVWVHYTRKVPGRTIAAWRLFDSGVPKSEIDGKIVFVGTSASRLMDLHATPLDPAAPGVEIHAQVAEQILSDHYLLRPDWADGAEMVYLLALGVGLILLLPRLGPLWCGGIGLSVAASAFPLSWYAFARWHWIFDPLFPALVCLLVYLSSSLISYWRSAKELRRLALLDMVKDEVISMVSHDLRAPVGSMIMVSDSMERGLYGPVSDEQKEALKLIAASGNRLIAFTDNVLDAAKIKAGRMELHRRELRAREVLAAVVELLAWKAAHQKIRLEMTVRDDLPPIDADSEKLEQVFNNLISNALKFTPEGGRVAAEAQVDGDFVRFCVRDTGMGIAAEDIPKLFAAFAQADVARQREMRVKGTGLGLSICRVIVEAHGGRIWVESAPQEGAAFYFTIPVFRAPKPS
jgi:signal transduction histidine kinase